MHGRVIRAIVLLLVAAFVMVAAVGCKGKGGADRTNQSAPKTPDEMKQKMKAMGMGEPATPKTGGAPSVQPGKETAPEAKTATPPGDEEPAAKSETVPKAGKAAEGK